MYKKLQIGTIAPCENYLKEIKFQYKVVAIERRELLIWSSVNRL